MEKGEVGILALQFGALVVSLLVLSNFVITSPLSTPTIQNVYWGAPGSGVAMTKGSLNSERVNASTISVFYTLAPSTVPDSASATRLCLSQNDTGSVYSYSKVSFLYDAAKHGDYISFGPTGQAIGETCTYTVQLTDSLQQTTTWVAIVQVRANTTA